MRWVEEGPPRPVTHIARERGRVARRGGAQHVKLIARRLDNALERAFGAQPSPLAAAGAAYERGGRASALLY